MNSNMLQQGLLVGKLFVALWTGELRLQTVQMSF